MAMLRGTTVSAEGSQRSAHRHWCGADESCRVSISGETLEQMRFEISRAMNGPGGQGVGGVLLGSVLGGSFRITGFRLIPCEHALGPEFRLSAAEESRLPALLDGLQTGARPEDGAPVGWFVSHPRGDVQMRAEERRIHGQHFGNGQLAMIAKPDRLGEMELAVYYGEDEANGGARFVAPVWPVVPNSSFRPARKAALAGRQRSEVEISMSNVPETVRPAVRSATGIHPRGARKRRLLAPALAVLGLLLSVAAFYWYSQRAGRPSGDAAASQAPLEMLSLHVYESSGRFYISWNGKAEAIRMASGILLLIQDGDQTSRYHLSSAEAGEGLRIHTRTSNEVKVTLEVRSRSGGVLEESTHFVSSDFNPPALLRVTPGTSQVEDLDTPQYPPASPQKY